MVFIDVSYSTLTGNMYFLLWLLARANADYPYSAFYYYFDGQSQIESCYDSCSSVYETEYVLDDCFQVLVFFLYGYVICDYVLCVMCDVRSRCIFL